MISFEDFKKLELKIGKIVNAKIHPDADRLYVLDVDLGEETKQIVAGIRKSYSEDELVGKHVVVATNLEPATIRGEESNGMVLAAASDKGPIIIVPEKDVSTGAVVK
ncbi:MAG: hypothetical protein ISS33_06145 [Candidatus Omnitrophica bacterium]|nr:hypothetical protein [Candidatus Omnitrophota bacterium]